MVLCISLINTHTKTHSDANQVLLMRFSSSLWNKSHTLQPSEARAVRRLTPSKEEDI